jgi:hypothetical protein
MSNWPVRKPSGVTSSVVDRELAIREIWAQPSPCASICLSG